jgi:hypothetical protein
LVVLLNEAGTRELTEDGVELGVVVGHGVRVAGGTYLRLP